MAHQFHLRRQVEFADTDMAGIVHFANYFRYMEAVEHAFFRSLGLSVHQSDDRGAQGFARGEVRCTYRRPLVYEDWCDLFLRVTAKARTSLTYEITFRRHAGPPDAPPDPAGEIIAVGTVVAVCVRRQDGRLRAVPLPPAVSERITVATEG